MKTLEERLSKGTAEAWRPDKDDPDLIIGTVTEIDWGIGYDGESRYPILTIATEPDGEEKAVHGFHAVLMNRLLKHKPQPGERIGIKFLGAAEKKPGDKNNPPILYEVKVDRATQAFDWNAIAAEPEESYAPPPAAQEPVDIPPGAGDDGIPF